METLFCSRCGEQVAFTVERKSNNFVASCKQCGGFIKNVPHASLGVKNEELTFPFGKYKGIKIRNVHDLSYLRWAKHNLTTLSLGIQACINDRIKEIEL